MGKIDVIERIEGIDFIEDIEVIVSTPSIIYNLTILCDLQFDDLQFTIYLIIWRFYNFIAR